MPKNYNTKTTLIIVESPAKCTKIEQFLGPGYKCLASYGHLQTIASLKNINIENNFQPTYTIIDEKIKKKQIEILKKEIKKSYEVILASDADREGEMIAFSIIKIFQLPLNTKRIIFNEITKTAIHTAINNPRTIDMNIVYAQQTRQILDLIVGFKISPVLWKLIKNSKDNALSAGRCQTPALKLVYENQKEINESIEKTVYNTTGYFTNLNLPFKLNKQIDCENEMIDFLDKSIVFSHIYTCSLPVKVFKQPSEPLTTSKLQQISSNELHYSPKETMRICQLLYESGYITYMRTDSKTYSDEFLVCAKEYITNMYNSEYLGEILNGKCHDNNIKKRGKKKENNSEFAQEAHEAIRPTNIFLQNLPEEMDTKEKKMYKLIWVNTLESCMSSASFYSITASISAPDNAKYSYTTQVIDFPGWKIIENNFSQENKEYNYLQTIKANLPIQHKKICSRLMIKDSKMHYTEARLVQLLEEKGIGRPSTFSSLIDKIQERGYVKKQDVKGKEINCKDFELENREIIEIETTKVFGNEKSKLVIQSLGIIVMEFLDKHFNKLFNYEYTCLMEESLDKITKNEVNWIDVCSDCNKEVDNLIEAIRNETKYEVNIDKNNTFLIGKHGPVIKCVEEKNGKKEISFKSVKKDIDVSKIIHEQINIDEIIEPKNTQNAQYNLGNYQGKDVILRKGKFGLYASWGNESRSLKELGNRPIENITFDQVKQILDKGSNIVREINSQISIRKGSNSDYLFFKNLKMKKPKFYDIKGFLSETNYDYKICDMVILKSWIKEKYNLKI